MKQLLLTTTLALLALAGVRADWPQLPQPATSFGATLAGGQLYVYGGNTGKAHEFHTGCIKGDFHRAKVGGSGAWEKLASGPALLSPSLVTYGDTVLRIGGMQARNAKGEKNDLHSTNTVARFDVTSGAWTALPALPQERSSHDAAILHDVLYVIGGWKLRGHREGDWCQTMLTLDLRAPEKGWRELPQPFERRALALVVLGERLWCIGGMNSDNEPTGEVDWFEPATGQWGKGPALPDGPMKGFGVAACADGGKLYASPLSGALLALSADGSKWEQVKSLAKPRFFHRLVAIGDGRLLAVGGSSRQAQIPEVEVINVHEKPMASAATQASASTWPQWRGPARDGKSAETGWLKTWPVEGPKLLWCAKVGVGMSSPVVAGGAVILHGNDGEGTDTVRALDTQTSAERWRFSFPCRTLPHEMPIVPPGPGATPTVEEASGAVYVLSREGDFFCLGLKDGAVRWKTNLLADLRGKRPVYGYSQSPLVWQGKVIVEIGAEKGGAGSTVALDAACGQPVWKGGTGEAGYSSARVIAREGRDFVALFKGEGLEIFDPADGKVVASFPTTCRDFSNAATPALVGHQVLVSNTGTDPATLLDWQAGSREAQPVWTQKQFALLFNSAIETDGCLFGFNEKRRGRHEFTCLDVKTGEARWVSDAVPTGTSILADGHWLFLTREGEVVVAPATAKELKPTARFKALEGKCYATPALVEGRLVVRNNAGEVAAFDLRP